MVLEGIQAACTSQVLREARMCSPIVLLGHIAISASVRANAHGRECRSRNKLTFALSVETGTLINGHFHGACWALTMIHSAGGRCGLIPANSH